ncbi:MAG: Gfo/Idh/MocA family oxidoreductase, partial [Bacteroidetes bacterium]|nr:Gfo/Idh/MocA family oxidoreductase [Bacteroidota bacterium]
MTEKIKLGVIGMSEGNGHPYSWSAIMNGYTSVMEECPFPAIPAYLKQEAYPNNFINNALVTHVWTQDLQVSHHIAKSAKIANVCADKLEMLSEVDGVLLARDDAENHMGFAKEFIQAGLPIYIDKPVAHSMKNLDTLLSWQQYEGQLFTCSALRYADELMLSVAEQEELGDLRMINAVTPKSWEKYAVHIIEPLVARFGPFELDKIHTTNTREVRQLTGILNERTKVNLTSVGNTAHPIQLEFVG